MGSDDCSHFDQIRVQNRRIVRNLMRHFSQIGKAELAGVSGLSFPTISALLSDLMQTGEVVLLPDASSRGGRPAEQFALNPAFQAAACAYVENHELFIRVYDVFGNVLFNDRKALEQGLSPARITQELLAVKENYPMLSIVCLGIPGVVVQGHLTYMPDYPDLEGMHLQNVLEEALSVSVFIENDVNVFVSGERRKWPDLVHIFYGTNCPGAGILLNRTIVRGANGCAGELEYLPFEHEGKRVTFAEKLEQIAQKYEGAQRRTETLSCLARAISSIVCVINPPVAALSGFDLNASDLGDLHRELEQWLPAERCPELHIVDPVDDLYQDGLLEIALEYWKSK